MIKLHPQLEKDCFLLGEFDLCSLLLLDDTNYPWFILLPQRDKITEIHQLTKADQQQLMNESVYFSCCLEDTYQPDKINIAALGNVVPQLHIHHIARFKTDACWPAPVWGKVKPVKHEKKQVKQLSKQLFTWFEHHSEQAFIPVKY